MRRSSRQRVLVAAVAAVAAVLPLALSGPAGAAPAPAAPDGPGGTAARWDVRHVAPGVEVRSGVLTRRGAAPEWTVSVLHPVTARLSGAPADAEVGPRSWADATAAALRAAGYAPREESVPWPDYTDTPHGTMGVRVRIGGSPDQATAQAVAQRLTAAGFPASAEWTGYDASRPADVEDVHVAVVDPAVFTGTVAGTHDGSVTGRETTSSVAARLASLVGVNGGFFVTADTDGVQGTQSGLGVYGGQVESMAAGSRAALVLGDGGRRARIADLTSSATATADGSSYPVQGINRVPGVVRDCGRPGAVPSTLPWQDVTCHEADELVRFTPAFTAALPAGDGVQAVLDGRGRVVSVGARGGSVPAGGSVVQGIGAAAGWLTAHARPGHALSVRVTVRDAAGRPVPLGRRDSVVSAAPVLVRDGRTAVDAASEGTVDPADLSFGYAWANTRQPRTMAGVDARGRLLLVTVDGRQKGGSEGFTLTEAAAFMRSLGAVSAMNLDGGGSTAMAVDGTLVNQPSDATGERPVGDTVQVLPAG